MATYQDYQKLADAVYSGSATVSYQDVNKEKITWTKVTEHGDLLNGYYGALYKSDNGEYIMVNRGTDKFSPPDYGNDAQMFFKQEIPAQYADAKQFYHEVQQYIANNGGGSFTLDGHSLGGTLSQMLSVEFGTQAVTFNPFSARNILDSLQPLSIEQRNQFTQQKTELEARILSGEQLSIELTTHLADITNQLNTDAAIHQLAENWQNGSEGNILNYLIKGDPISDIASAAQLGDSITFSDLDHIGLGSHFINDFSIENLSTENLFNLSGTSGTNSKLQELLEYFKDKTNWEIDSAGSGYRISKDHELFFGVVEKGDDWESTGDDRSKLVTDLRDCLYTDVGLAKVGSAAAVAQKREDIISRMLSIKDSKGRQLYEIKHDEVHADKQSYLLFEHLTYPDDPKGGSASRYDPLILDLNNNQKIDTVGLDKGVLFNHQNDATKNATGWANDGDGLVVYDRDKSGSIESGNELLGENFTLGNGQKAKDGYAALADFDSNLDGVVNAKDSRFADLQVWIDKDLDGISDSGELHSLAELGIASLNVKPTTTGSQSLGNGNTQIAAGTFTKSDGTTGVSGAVNFVGDEYIREFIDKIDTSAVANLPDMFGAGTVRDLREAL